MDKILFGLWIIGVLTLMVFGVLNIRWIFKNRKKRFERREKTFKFFRHLVLFIILTGLFVLFYALLPEVYSEIGPNREEIIAAKNGIQQSINNPEMKQIYEKQLQTYRAQFILDFATIGCIILLAVNAIENLVLSIIYLLARQPKIED